MVNNGLYNMLFGEDKNASRFLEMLDMFIESIMTLAG